jgi:hypothetical protein
VAYETETKGQRGQLRKKLRKPEHQGGKFGLKAMKAVAAGEEGWRSRGLFSAGTMLL